MKPPEQAAAERFLTYLLRGDGVPSSPADCSWVDLMKACDEHDVTGLVHRELAGPSATTRCPDETLAALARRVRGDTAVELVRQREIIRVIDALAAHDLHPILLKGTALAYTVYPMPVLRQRRDTDVLVRREEIGTLTRVMLGLGYAATPHCRGELLFGQFELRKRDRHGVQHAFDVHWRISTQPVFADVLTCEELSTDLEAVPALGPHARTAGRLHALLLGCVHSAMHHRNAELLIWVYDLHLLASRLSPRCLDEFVDVALAKRVGRVCAHALSLAVRRFGTAIPDRLISRLAARGDREPSAEYLETGRRWHDELVSSLRGLPRWGDRARLVREVLLPAPTYMLSAYGVTNRKVGLAVSPALYVHRGVSGLWRVLAGRK